ncbi:hypothetical protein AHAS_Ahas17G0175500 [Arachis hypogaea]
MHVLTEDLHHVIIIWEREALHHRHHRNPRNAAAGKYIIFERHEMESLGRPLERHEMDSQRFLHIGGSTTKKYD